MNNIDFYYNSIESNLNFTRIFKNKISVIKKNNLQNSIKLLINKQKMRNLLKIYNIAKLKLSFHDSLTEIKKLRKNNKYSDLFQKLQNLKKSIEDSNEAIGSGRLVIFQSFNEKCDTLLLELTQNCSVLLSNLFLTKKADKYEQLFLFYYSQGEYLEV